MVQINFTVSTIYLQGAISFPDLENTKKGQNEALDRVHTMKVEKLVEQTSEIEWDVDAWPEDAVDAWPEHNADS